MGLSPANCRKAVIRILSAVALGKPSAVRRGSHDPCLQYLDVLRCVLSSISFAINEAYLNKGFDLKEFLEKTVSAIEEIKNA